MGQSLKKLAGNDEEMKEKEMRLLVIEKCYDTHFADPDTDWNSAQFLYAVSQTIEEINKMLGSTQLRVPTATTLEQAYNFWAVITAKEISFGYIEMLQRLMMFMGGTDFELQNHHRGKGKSLTKEEFQKILQAVILDTGVSGMGAKDMLLYIFGIPITALFIKQRLIPGAIPNDIFIPGVTSATVFLLAKLNKI